MGLSKKQLEIGNQELRDIIRTAICILEDETEDGRCKSAYTAGMLSVTEKCVNNSMDRGKASKREIWRIRYSDGTVGYKLYSKRDAIKDAERKKEMYGGSYTIEKVE